MAEQMNNVYSRETLPHYYIPGTESYENEIVTTNAYY